MASNKNPVRNTHEGYINSKNISQTKNSQRSEEENISLTKKSQRSEEENISQTKKSQRSEDENRQPLKNAMIKVISQGNQQSQHNSKQKHQPQFFGQADENDWELEYSFNSKAQIKETNNASYNANSFARKSGTQNSSYKKQLSVNDKQSTKGAVKEAPNPLLSKKFDSKESKSKTTASKAQEKLEQPHKQYKKIQILELSLKQAHYENKILKQQLLLSEDENKELFMSYSELERNYAYLTENYNQLQASYDLLSHKENESQRVPRQFIAECQEEIGRLKNLVNELSEQKTLLEFKQESSEREEIKDRIIMKLEDELITMKLLLKQEQAQNSHNRHATLTDITPSYNRSYNFEPTHKQKKTPLHELTTNRTGQRSPNQDRYNMSLYSANKPRLFYE